MTTFLVPIVLTIFFVGFMMLAMAVGVIFSGRELKGSCGGTGADCFCDRNGLPRACELKDGQIPAECNDHDHGPAQSSVHLVDQKLIIK